MKLPAARSQKRDRLQKMLESKPEIPEDLLLYWDAFSVITAGRNRDGVGDIERLSVREVSDYCDFFAITGQEQKDDLLRVLLAMDRRFRETLAKLAEEKSKSATKSAAAKTFQPRARARSRGRRR